MITKKFIYAYLEPRPENSRCGEVRYIGQTTTGFNRCTGWSGQYCTKARNWLKNLEDRKLKPPIKILAVLTPDASLSELNRQEIRFIAYYRSLGADLKNMTEGGGGTKGTRRSDEFKKRLADSNHNRVWLEESKLKVSLAKRGKHLSEEHKRNVGLAKKGQKHSEETIAKIRLANLGRVLPESTKLKLSLSMKGRKHSEEHNRKVGLGRKGKRHSPESILKMRLAKLGKPRSEETKRKISLGKIGKKASAEAKLHMKQGWQKRTEKELYL